MTDVAAFQKALAGVCQRALVQLLELEPAPVLREEAEQIKLLISRVEDPTKAHELALRLASVFEHLKPPEPPTATGYRIERQHKNLSSPDTWTIVEAYGAYADAYSQLMALRARGHASYIYRLSAVMEV